MKFHKAVVLTLFSVGVISPTFASMVANERSSASVVASVNSSNMPIVRNQGLGLASADAKDSVVSTDRKEGLHDVLLSSQGTTSNVFPVAPQLGATILLGFGAVGLFLSRRGH